MDSDSSATLPPLLSLSFYALIIPSLTHSQLPHFSYADANLATQLDITNSDLANNWEAFSLSHDDADHTDANFALFRTFVQSIVKKNGPKEDRKRPAQVMGSPSPNPNVKAAKTESNVTATMVGSR